MKISKISFFFSRLKKTKIKTLTSFIKKRINSGKNKADFEWQYAIHDVRKIYEFPHGFENMRLVGNNWLDNKRNLPILILWGFNDWKYGFITQYLKDYRVAFAPRKSMSVKILYNLRKFPEPIHNFVVWGINETLWVRALAKIKRLKIWRMEDGFLRSVNLGANHSTPYTIVLDKSGIYFDGRNTSDLVNILNNYDFLADYKLKDETKECLQLWKDHSFSKYNLPSMQFKKISTPKMRHRIAILGQVSGDASLKYANPKKYNSFDLIQEAIKEHPRSQIIYRPHPEELQKNKLWNSKFIKKIENICEVVDPGTGLVEFLDDIDEVYTISSLSGFEALLHGKNVTVFGTPFYAGWGLTVDRAPILNRQRKLSKENLFSAVYLLYSQYLTEPAGSKAKAFKAIAYRVLAEKKKFEIDNVLSLKFDKNDKVPGHLMLPYNIKKLKRNIKLNQDITISEFYSYFKHEFFNLKSDSYLYNEALIAVFIGLSPNDTIRAAVIKKIGHTIPLENLSRILKLLSTIHPGQYLDEAFSELLVANGELYLFQKLIEKNDPFTNQILTHEEINIVPEVDKSRNKNSVNHKLIQKTFEIKEFDRAFAMLIKDIVNGNVSATNINKLAVIAKQKFDLQSSAQLQLLSLYLSPNSPSAIFKLVTSLEFDIEKDFNSFISYAFLAAIFAPKYAADLKLVLEKNLDTQNANYWWDLLVATFELDNNLNLSKVDGFIAIGQPENAKKVLLLSEYHDDWSPDHAIAWAKATSYSGDIESAISFMEDLIKYHPQASTFKEYLRLCILAGYYRKGLIIVREAASLKIELGDMLPRKIFFGNRLVFEAFDSFRQFWFKKTINAYFPEKYVEDVKDIQESILLLAIFGPGDEIRFASVYNKICAQLDGFDVTFSCDPRLQSLFERSFPSLKFVKIERQRGSEKLNFETHGDLPGSELNLALDNCGLEALRSRKHVSLITDFLSSTLKGYDDFDGLSYLTPCRKTAEKWSSIKPQGLVVGISWRSSLTTASRNEHYLTIKDLAPIFDLKSVTFINLQYDDCFEELEWVNKKWPGKIWDPEHLDQYNELDDVAALMSTLPLIISPATTVAEMSGALGIPTWLLSNSSELHWRKNDTTGEDVWHNSMRHIEANNLGDKADLVESLRHQLQCWITQNKQ